MSSLRREQVQALEAKLERVRAFLLELTGGSPLEELQLTAGACRGEFSPEAWAAETREAAGELLADLDRIDDVPGDVDGSI
jgi:hypothetical protein